ncbi:Glycosyl transferases group 1 [Arthrobacter sp. ov407]|uniref:glycosyltransferase n=1 Tax=Arthrobacter sp. ov407 TaxID=1761748 RepID=UPI00088EEC2C|nr:glycosyltransferase [Arthrobacter sp. ov407]SDL62022.1 Glycosyl transferases group 1 [Arthrobacter sp. ov407]
MPPASLCIRLVVPGNVRHNSGGNVYNAALARELAALGAEVETCPLDGDWPGGSAGDRRRLAGLLQQAPANPGSPTGSVTLVDSLLACGAPDELEAAAAAGQQVWILLHMPLPDHAERERRALQAAAGVICTSSSAAAGIRARHGLDGVRVALPGTAPAPLAAGSLSGGSGVPHIIAVAALLENKDQSLLLDALARLADLPWTASLIGSDTAHPAYAAQLRDSVERLGLTGRVSIPGELRGPALEAEWDAADLSLLISRAETYGLVVTESLARGIPVVVRAGTGAVEALGAGNLPGSPGPDMPVPDMPVPDMPLPGAAVELGTDPAPLADLLRGWLGHPGLRERWRDAAADARGRLPGWDATARTVVEFLPTESPVSPESPETGKIGTSAARVRSAPGQAVGE